MHGDDGVVAEFLGGTEEGLDAPRCFVGESCVANFALYFEVMEGGEGFFDGYGVIVFCVGVEGGGAEEVCIAFWPVDLVEVDGVEIESL